MYSALIIDDEADARQVLSRLLEIVCPDIKMIVAVKTAQEALAAVSKRAFDMAFIDIRLRQANGLELANRLIRYCPNLIFVTAHDQYAVAAYRTEAIDYLLKPVNPEHLRKAVDRAKQNVASPPERQERLILSTKEGMIVLVQAEILRVEGDGNYCTFHSRQGQKYLVSKNLSHYEELLSSERFQRTHQSHLVNLAAVREYLNRDGKAYTRLENGDLIPVARRRKEKFKRALQRLGR